MINTSQNIDKAQAIAQGGYVGQKGTWNALYTDPKTGKLLRDRVEVIVIKDGNKIFMRLQGGDKYRLPGGGCEHDRTKIQQAIEETKEEARLNIHSVRDTGIEWCRIFDKPGDKARLEGDKDGKILWYGDHTTLFIAEYDSPYTGEVKKIDQDPDLAKNGDFYPIDLVWHMLTDNHKAALEKFNYFNTSDLIKKVNECCSINDVEKVKSIIENCCRTTSDKVFIESIIDTKIETMLSDTKPASLPMYPYFTPQEVNNIIKVSESNEWFKVYQATGNPGYNYNKLVTEAMNEYTKNPSDENRTKVLELAWNPEVEINSKTIANANKYTRIKLQEFYGIEVVNLCEVDHLTDTVDNLFKDLGEQIKKHIKDDLESEDRKYSSLKGHIQLTTDDDVLYNNNPNIYVVADYGLNQNTSAAIDSKIFDELIDDCNRYLASLGYTDIEVSTKTLDNNPNKDSLYDEGMIVLQQIMEREVTIGESTNVDEVNAAPNSAIMPMGIHEPMEEEILKKQYKKSIDEGQYTGDLELDRAYCIDDQEAKTLGQTRRRTIIDMTKQCLAEINRAFMVDRNALINFLSHKVNYLNFYTGDDYKEVITEVNSYLLETDYMASPNSFNTAMIHHKIGQYLKVQESTMISESGSKMNRKELVSYVQNICANNKFPLKITKNGEWGLNKFLSGDDNNLFLVGGYKECSKMVRVLNKELKGTGAHCREDNYYTIFLTVKKDTVAEDTLLEALHESSKELKPIFIVNSFTDTRFGNLITKFTGSNYSHSAIAFDPSLENLYTYNAGNGNLFGGFSIESIEGYKQKSDKALAQINVMFVSKEIYNKLQDIVMNLSDNVKNTTYNFGNLFNVVFHKEDNNQNINSMICSQFVDNILKTVNINLTNVASNLVTPAMLAKVEHPRVFLMFEGKLKDFSIKSFKNKYYKLLSKGIKPIKESRLASLLQLTPILEAKSFPIQFDEDGNLLIKNRKKIDYNVEYKKTKKLRKEYVKYSNVEAMKYEAAKCWYINQCIEKDLDDPKHSKYELNDLKLYRSRILTEFSQYMKEIIKVQGEFNFTAYYNSTPFSDDATQINASSLKYASIYLKKIFNCIL